MRNVFKAAAHAICWVLVTPSVCSWALRSRIVGVDRAFEASTQAWALLPGLSGQYLRRAFLSRTLPRCAPSATIEFGTIFSSASATIAEHAYIGPRCHLGFVHIERDALLAAGVHVPSGAHTHGTDDLSIPIREQPGTKAAVRIGEGAWIGSAAIILADVGHGTIVGAAAVVTRPLPGLVVAGGVPARIISHRTEHHQRDAAMAG
jgi:virginiamycin A acetyltransferase